jgi:hypothetical protein
VAVPLSAVATQNRDVDDGSTSFEEMRAPASAENQTASQPDRENI